MKKKGVLILEIVFIILTFLIVFSLFFNSVKLVEAQEDEREAALEAARQAAQEAAQKAAQKAAQEVSEGQLGELEETGEQIENFTESIESLREKEKWQYLSQQWKEILLKNKFVSVFDGALTKVSVVFLVLFGEHYSLSLTLLVVIILWFFFFFEFSEILKDFSTFSPSVSYAIGFGLTLILAHLKILRKITDFFFWLVFYKEAMWWRTAIIFAIIIVLVVLYTVSSKIGKSTKEAREKKKLEEEKLKIETGAKAGEALSEAAKGLSENE